MTRTRLPNYKNTILLDIIAEVLPAGAQQWETVASRYFDMSGEAAPRDADMIKRHFNDKLCNGGKKPTGEAGSKTDLILRAQRIKLCIYQRQSIGSAGNGIGNSFDGEDDIGEGFEEDDLDEEDANDNNGADEDQLFGTQYQATQAQVATSQGGTAFAVIPNGPQAPPQQAAGSKRTSTQELPHNKTKSMKTGSGRQAAAGQINALNNTLQGAVESGNNAMLIQFMLQMQQQQSQQNMMMMMFLGMGRNQTPQSPFPPMQNSSSPFASPTGQHSWSGSSSTSSTTPSSANASSSFSGPVDFTSLGPHGM